MADKAVSELIAAEQITATDLFVLEQNGTAKKLTGQVLLNWLTKAADGHGGISGIARVSTSGLVDTYRITLADTNTFDFVVTNGKGVDSIKKTATEGLVDTYTIHYNDGTTDTITVTNGEKGEPGAAAYLWIKYASQMPTEDSQSFGDVPDDWIGVYSGTADTAPEDWTQYQWFRFRGPQGDKGDPATLVSAEVTYQVGDSGTVEPSGLWLSYIPAVAQGKYLWTRIVQHFNSGDPVTAYTVARMGLDGLGSVVTVCGVSPDANGNVPLTAEDVGALSPNGGTVKGDINMDGHSITGLSEPVNSGDAVPKSYADKLAKRHNISVTTPAVIAVGATHIVNESALGRSPVFATLAYSSAIGRVAGATGDKHIYFHSVDAFNAYMQINCAAFKLSDDGLVYTLENTKRFLISDSGVTVYNNISMHFGEVVLID